MRSYKDLDAWKNAMQLVKEIYLLTKKFPKEELYALTSQTKAQQFLFHPILRKDSGGSTKKILCSFYIFQEAHCMNWKLY